MMFKKFCSFRVVFDVFPFLCVFNVFFICLLLFVILSNAFKCFVFHVFCISLFNFMKNYENHEQTMKNVKIPQQNLVENNRSLL